MKRVWRFLLAGATIASLLLCAGLIWLWGASRQRNPWWGVRGGESTWHVVVVDGRCRVTRVFDWSDAASADALTRTPVGIQPLVDCDYTLTVIDGVIHNLLPTKRNLERLLVERPDDAGVMRSLDECDRKIAKLRADFYSIANGRGGRRGAEPVVVFYGRYEGEKWGMKFNRGWGAFPLRGFGGGGGGGGANTPGVYSAVVRYWSGEAPLWPLVALTAVAPVVAMSRWTGRRVVRWHRRRTQCCLACGYDLRATPLRCPECGAVPAARGG
jgi:hypothetical protein